MIDLYMDRDCTYCQDVLITIAKNGKSVDTDFNVIDQLLDEETPISKDEKDKRDIILDPEHGGGWKGQIPYLVISADSIGVIDGKPRLEFEEKIEARFDKINDIKGYGTFLHRDYRRESNNFPLIKFHQPVSWFDPEGTYHLYETGLIKEVLLEHLA